MQARLDFMNCLTNRFQATSLSIHFISESTEKSPLWISLENSLCARRFRVGVKSGREDQKTGERDRGCDLNLLLVIHERRRMQQEEETKHIATGDHMKL